jgi:hypothetical protein
MDSARCLLQTARMVFTVWAAREEAAQPSAGVVVEMVFTVAAAVVAGLGKAQPAAPGLAATAAMGS